MTKQLFNKTLLLLAIFVGGSLGVSAETKTGTITFGKDNVKINAASVTGEDDFGNEWTITTVGTTSYTSNASYYQIGSSSYPATSITFTTTLAANVNIIAMSAKFGGFSGTAGNVTLKVDDTAVGTGSLNAAKDVTVSSTSIATGKVLTVTVTDIAKGVKAYNISYTYTTAASGEKEDATIVVNDKEEVTYGKTFTVDDSMIEGGDITLTSSNENVATVSGLVITPKAVGSTTITISTAENEAYKAGSETFTLVVKAPTGKTTAPYTGFVKVRSTSDVTDGQYLIVYETEKFAFNGGLETLDATGNKISVTIADGTIAANDNTNAAVFTYNAAEKSLQSASGKYIGQTKNDNGLVAQDEPITNSVTISDGDANIVSGGAYLRYNANSGQVRFRYFKSSTYTSQKAIQLYKKSEAPTITVTLNGSGYATYCSEYPLDFSDYETADYSAWQVTDITGTDIKFEQITSSIKGGEGILLKGEAGATVTLKSTSSNEALGDNFLDGTLAPQYVDAGEYYGLSGNSFVKINAGTVPAGKAILNAEWIGTNSARLNMVFDSEATGIDALLNEKGEMRKEKCFDLQGRRVVQPQRSATTGDACTVGLKKGLYIMGGKKLIVK